MNKYTRMAGVIGFTGAVLTGVIVSATPDESTAVTACARNEHPSWSKYAGNVCIPDGGKVGKGLAQFSVGCLLGLPGGVTGLAYGCAGGLASVVIDNSFF